MHKKSHRSIRTTHTRIHVEEMQLFLKSKNQIVKNINITFSIMVVNYGII